MAEPNLSLFPMPSWSSPREIEKSLADIRSSTDAESSQDAYNRILDAVGHNHAGVYFPVAVPVMLELGEILQLENKWARSAVLNALVDLCHSFEPAGDHPTVLRADGSTAGVDVALREAVTSLRPILSTLLEHSSTDADERTLTSGMLKWIDRSE